MVSKDFMEYVIKDLLRDIDGVSTRRMFSGVGIYKNGIIFAIVINDTLFFKTDATNQHLYKKYNSKPFSFMQKNKMIELSYWEVPADVIENKILLQQWLEQSYLINKTKKSQKK